MTVDGVLVHERKDAGREDVGEKRRMVDGNAPFRFLAREETIRHLQEKLRMNPTTFFFVAAHLGFPVRDGFLPVERFVAPYE